MTDTQEAMREKSLLEYREELERESGYVLSEEMENAYRDGWEDATAQSAEKMARLEAENATMRENLVTIRRQSAAAELSNKQLREALEYYQDAVCDSGKINYEYDPEDDGKIAREALAQQPSTDALDAYVATFVLARDKLFCEAIIATQSQESKFGRLNCDSAELLHYFNEHKDADTTPLPPALEKG